MPVIESTVKSLSPEECLAGMKELSEQKERSSSSTARFRGLLKSYLDCINVENLLTTLLENNRLFLNLILKQSFVTADNGNTYFNPTLSLYIYNLLPRHERSQKNFFNLEVVIEGATQQTVTIGELVDGGLCYLADELLIAPALAAELFKYTALGPGDSVEVRLYHALDDPDQKNQLIKKTLSETLNGSTMMDLSSGIELFEEVFALYLFALNNQHSEQTLLQHFDSKLRGFQSRDRLILLHFKPYGADKNLKQLLEAFITPLMQRIVLIENMGALMLGQRQTHSEFIPSRFEEFLQFFPIIDLKDLVEQAFKVSDVNIIEFLLASRLDQLQQIHQTHNLLQLYITQCPNSKSINILYRLFQYGFKPCKDSPSNDLNQCLHDVVSQIYTSTNENNSIFERKLKIERTPWVIEQLVKAGADVNAPNHQGVPPLFCANHVYAFRALLELGANVNYITVEGKSILSYWLGDSIQALDYEKLHAALKGGLSLDIIDKPYSTTSPNTLLAYLLDPRRALSLIEVRSCIMATIDAGANPLFWKERGFAYRELISLFPDHEKLKSYEKEYEALARTQGEFLKLQRAITEAINDYCKNAYNNNTVSSAVISYDIGHKIAYLNTIKELFTCAFSISELYNAVKVMIATFSDSSMKGIITVARHPTLSAHQALFNLVNTLFEGLSSLEIINLLFPNVKYFPEVTSRTDEGFKKRPLKEEHLPDRQSILSSLNQYVIDGDTISPVISLPKTKEGKDIPIIATMRDRQRKKEWHHYFEGEIPISLLGKEQLVSFLRTLHPDDYHNINFFELFKPRKDSYGYYHQFDKLHVRQLEALFTLLVNGALLSGECLSLVMSKSIIGIDNTSNIRLFYTILLTHAPRDRLVSALPAILKIVCAREHVKVLYNMLPVSLLMDGLYNKRTTFSLFEFNYSYREHLTRALIGNLEIKDGHSGRMGCSPAIPLVVGDDLESLAQWKGRIQSFYETAVKNENGDTIFHHAARHATIESLRGLFKLLSLTSERLALLFMKNKQGESVISLLLQRSSLSEVSYLFLELGPSTFFNSTENEEADLKHPLMRELCLEAPEFFFILLNKTIKMKIPLSIQLIHAPHRGTSLLSLALDKLPQPCGNHTFLEKLDSNLREYFNHRQALQIQRQIYLRAANTIYSADPVLVRKNQEVLNRFDQCENMDALMNLMRNGLELNDSPANVIPDSF